MRRRQSANGITVHAIAGSHAVLLAMDAEAAQHNGLLGFAIRHENPGTGDGGWLRGFKFFEQTVPDPAPGERRSTLEHPVQSFLWGHYAAEPDTGYRYTVRPVYGTPAQLDYGSDVTVEVHTESVEAGEHSVFFNRGAVPSQKFADLFGNRGPVDENDPGADDVKWLSRGLLEALAAAARAGADVRVVYEDGQEKKTACSSTHRPRT